MNHFIRTFLKGPISDINHKFILPSLSLDQNKADYIGPDFRQLILSLTHSSTLLKQMNTNLFYSLLIIEPSFEEYSFGK